MASTFTRDISASQVQDPDAAIRETDTDASQARWSAVQRGYLVDPFVRYFVQRPHLVQPRAPLINIGTYVRSSAIDMLVERWIDRCDGKVQIISLGAGRDTRFWRLSTGRWRDRVKVYVELDFPEVTTRKAMAIRKSPALSAPLGEKVHIEDGGTSLTSPTYILKAADLRIPPSDVAALQTIPLERDIPTLLLSECVFPYMRSSQSDALMEYFSSRFSILGCIVYEMFGLTDSFGRVMKSNLQARGVALLGVDAYPTKDDLTKRFTQHGFDRAWSKTLKDIRQDCISEEEKRRISGLEMLDEVEELDLVLQHYAITWGMKESDNKFAEWSLD